MHLGRQIFILFFTQIHSFSHILFILGKKDFFKNKKINVFDLYFDVIFFSKRRWRDLIKTDERNFLLNNIRFIYYFIQIWGYFLMKYTMKIDYQLLINMKLYFFGIFWLNYRYSLIFGLHPLFWEGAHSAQNFTYLIKNFRIFWEFSLKKAKFWIK